MRTTPANGLLITGDAMIALATGVRHRVANVSELCAPRLEPHFAVKEKETFVVSIWLGEYKVWNDRYDCG
jgi:hypothetical protein